MQGVNRQRYWPLALAIAALAMIASDAGALTLKPMNLVDLVRDSDSIVVGSVTTVTDGITESGFPYTEITISVEEAIRGSFADTFAFRQIGLLTPRPTADGRMVMAAAPPEIPRYTIGDHVLLFLGEPASMTGLRTTLGLGVGRFVLGAGQAQNDYANEGVFSNVSVDSTVATSNDQRILATSIGAVNPNDLLSLVRRAVQSRWATTCMMWKSDEGPLCEVAPPRRRPIKPPGNTLPTSPIGPK